AASARARSAEAAQQAAPAEERRARRALLAAGESGGEGAVLVKAPVAAVVLRVPQESEAVVASGTPLIVLGDPARVDVVAEFLSQDAVTLRPGAAAFIENWGGCAAGGAHRTRRACGTHQSVGARDRRAAHQRDPGVCRAAAPRAARA
ncbi:MAG: HlyD family efflux transporter periplasmic adaptor subunit, partial [Nevskiaceae bacterium]